MLLLSLCVVDVACSAVFVSVRNGGWYGALISVGGTCMSGVALPMRLLPSFVCLCEGCERSILRRDPMQRFCMHPANALDPLEGTKLPCNACYLLRGCSINAQAQGIPSHCHCNIQII
jgi:hypothetical protein